jgi:hypothetical protein
VERHRRDLEAETDQQQADGGERQRALLGGERAELHRDRRQRGGAEGAERHGDAEQQEAGREGAEQEVLERRLAGAQLGRQMPART